MRCFIFVKCHYTMIAITRKQQCKNKLIKRLFTESSTIFYEFAGPVISGANSE